MDGDGSIVRILMRKVKKVQRIVLEFRGEGVIILWRKMRIGLKGEQ